METARSMEIPTEASFLAAGRFIRLLRRGSSGIVVGVTQARRPSGRRLSER